MQANFSITPISETPANLDRLSSFAENTLGVEKKYKANAQSSDLDAVQNSAETNEQLNNLQNILADHNISLKFSRDTETKAWVVEMIDKATGEALRQLPTEISLKLAAQFMKIQGQFFSQKA